MKLFKDKLRCSFCAKSEDEVKKLIAGPTVYICNECVDLCVLILRDDARVTGVTLDELLPMTTGRETPATRTYH